LVSLPANFLGSVVPTPFFNFLPYKTLLFLPGGPRTVVEQGVGPQRPYEISSLQVNVYYTGVYLRKGRYGVSSYGDFGSSLRDLPRLRSGRRKRASSWDRSGGNDDRLIIEPGQTALLSEISGAGCVNHVWITAAIDGLDALNTEPDFLRKVLLKMYWDGENQPSVLVPLGDFFGVGHGRTANFVSSPIQMSPENGKSFNCFFHMPFADGARIEVISELQRERVLFYYYIDYEEFDELERSLGRFHAQWRRENPTDGVEQGKQSNEEFLFGGENIGGEGNYVILEAEGKGHYVGCLLNVHNLRETDEWNWYGEGDDMIFIDGEEWPPSLHGTGMEDYFNTAWSPRQEYYSPYHGITLGGRENWSGQISFYRFHIEDPVPFEKSIRVTIEHGHANKRSDDYSSVAYWYQTEPHRPFSILPVEQRISRPVREKSPSSMRISTGRRWLRVVKRIVGNTGVLQNRGSSQVR
jgi:D-arabinan exo alpha-(1,3)/(1,5)-arabinofuranosidase (non-reducing end)